MSGSSSRNDKHGTQVCVTGASGFIGSHVVRELLERGYRVRATVRDANDEAKVGHLRKLAEGAAHPLEIVRADLLDEGSFDTPFSGCQYIFHVAASVRLTAKDPQREIVDVAVLGTENALRAASKAKTVERVVLTSSVAAVFDLAPRPEHVYTEADWTSDATLSGSPYPLAKTLSEKRAWELVEDESFDLVAINPAMVMGPVMSKAHLRSSPALLRDLLTGKFPAAPSFHFGIVDVRDVARAHVEAVERSQASGRHIMYTQGKWMRELCDIMRQHFPQFSKVPKRRMPNALMYVVAMFDSRLSWSFLRRSLDVANQVDASRVERELGIEPIAVEQSVIDTCQSFIDLGYV